MSINFKNTIANLNKKQIIETLKEEAIKKSLPANKKVATVEVLAVAASFVLGDWSDVALVVAGAVGFNQLVSRSKPLHNIIIQEAAKKVAAVNNIVHDTVQEKLEKVLDLQNKAVNEAIEEEDRARDMEEKVAEGTGVEVDPEFDAIGRKE
jgi:hypothetical protein